jgi:peptide/nickel transport system permease protein
MSASPTSSMLEAPNLSEPISDVGEMSQWKLMYRQFIRSRLAIIGIVILGIMYILVGLGQFLAPNDYLNQNQAFVFSPPSPITFVGSDGKLGLRPYTYEMEMVLNEETFQFDFVANKEAKVPIRFLVPGSHYKLLGLFPTNLHLFGVADPNRVYLLGADALGRDMLARILIGGQVSMTVGLVGVALTIIFGSILGTASGYFGGLTDDIMQRVIELIQSFPTVPLWAALAAALPEISSHFTMIHRYFLITVILSLVGWTGLARQLRAKVMAYGRADFVSAARAVGASDAHVIFAHMLPNAASHIIVVAALAIPGMILGETALSFLGLGILPPAVSWGALLRDSQKVTVVVDHPWLLIPGLAVVLAVLGFSFLGDALRDAADPYSV